MLVLRCCCCGLRAAQGWRGSRSCGEQREGPHQAPAPGSAPTDDRQRIVRCDDDLAARNHTLFSGFRTLYPAISASDSLALKVKYPSGNLVQPRSLAIAAAIAGDFEPCLDLVAIGVAAAATRQYWGWGCGVPPCGVQCLLLMYLSPST